VGTDSGWPRPTRPRLGAGRPTPYTGCSRPTASTGGWPGRSNGTRPVPLVHRRGAGHQAGIVRLPDVRAVRAAATGYACPMTCPKQLRTDRRRGLGERAVRSDPELRCVWVTAYERAERAGHGGDLDLLQRPVDHREWGAARGELLAGPGRGLWVDPAERHPLLRASWAHAEMTRLTPGRPLRLAQTSDARADPAWSAWRLPGLCGRVRRACLDPKPAWLDVGSSHISAPIAAVTVNEVIAAQGRGEK